MNILTIKFVHSSSHVYVTCFLCYPEGSRRKAVFYPIQYLRNKYFSEGRAKCAHLRFRVFGVQHVKALKTQFQSRQNTLEAILRIIYVYVKSSDVWQCRTPTMRIRGRNSTPYLEYFSRVFLDLLSISPVVWNWNVAILKKCYFYGNKVNYPTYDSSLYKYNK